MICLCLTKPSLEANSQLIKKYATYIDVLELRADFLLDPSWIDIEKWCKKIIKTYNLPIIFTLRNPQDGGNWSLGESKRIAILIQAIQSNIFRWVDVEIDIQKFDNNNPSISELNDMTNEETNLILSQHEFQESINDTWAQTLIQTAKNYPDCLVKSAVKCNSSQELVDFFSQCETLKENIPNRYIVAPMGLFGIPGRILRCYSGSFINYCSESGKDGLQHLGQIDPRTLIELYHYKDIDTTTELYAIAGNPVMHSLSPPIHNAFFKRNGLQNINMTRPNKVYIHLPLDECISLKQLTKLINFRGLSVTIPHKTSILSMLDSQDAFVELSQSCNTVAINNGHWHGFNTDIGGFLLPLFRALKIDTPKLGRLKGKSVTVIGAGGAAKALAFALLLEGANILIVNRSQNRAIELADQLNTHNTHESKIEIATLQSFEIISSFSDIIVQTTSVGMKANPTSPIPDFPFQGHELVYDIIYTPPITKLLKDAKNAGCQIITGKEMFIHQAILQSKIFCGENQ